MLLQQTIETLQKLRLTGFLHGLIEQESNPAAKELTFEDRLGLLIDREAVEQENRKLSSRLKQARLRQNVAVEEFDWRASRGVSKSVLMELASCRWVADHRNLIIIGPTGVGKTFLACSLAQKACRDGYSALYQRASRMFHELMVARGEGKYLRSLKTLSKPEILLIDDCGLEPLGRDQRHDLLEIFEERSGRKSMILTSQVPVEKWHELIGDATLADAILDRVIHNSHLINMIGESMRKKMGPKPISQTGG